MGHERLGILPKTKPWIRIVDELMSSDNIEDKVEIVANQTLQNVQSRFSRIDVDPGVLASFKFLVILAVSTHYEYPLLFLSSCGIDLGANASAYFIAKALNKYVESNLGSNEYGEIARVAAQQAYLIFILSSLGHKAMANYHLFI